MKFIGLKSWWNVRLAVSAVIVSAIVVVVQAQPPRGDREGRAGGGGVDAAINRLMAYDADKDGKLSKAEMTDSRLLPLWQRCDANHDGEVTRDELTSQLRKEDNASNRGGNGGGPVGPGSGGPGGGPPGRGPGGPPPGFGQILPPLSAG